MCTSLKDESALAFRFRFLGEATGLFGKRLCSFPRLAGEFSPLGFGEGAQFCGLALELHMLCFRKWRLPAGSFAFQGASFGGEGPGAFSHRRGLFGR